MVQCCSHKTLCIVPLLILCLTEGLAPRTTWAGELYKYVKNGVTHYTNRPPEYVNSVKLSSPTAAIRTVSSGTTTAKTLQSKSSGKIPYSHLIYKIAKKYEMSPELVKAVIKVESNYNHRAVSPKGAQGLMQLMPETAKRFGVKDAFDAEQNITGGIKYLRFLLNEFGEHNLDLVLAGYNAGEQAVRKYGNKVPPYRETRKYVKMVKALYLGHSKYANTRIKSIYRYVDKNGIVAFTNIPRVN
ncbi:hypothetical protein CSA56_02790 [candidate division KSB3 bacterium]|uniref:Transglycosylase SLT domain-containing protein n=1 Tax=candidate division KSB3 bacterium TaxID=2044937 RepID=A0A2G6KJF2_9BACT|nr:MAG: hypothetical protein CSA56_02790 [candidate division KSB3 bacterium]